MFMDELNIYVNNIKFRDLILQMSDLYSTYSSNRFTDSFEDFEKKQNELDKRKKEFCKKVNVKRAIIWLEVNNLLKFNIFSNDICSHILSYVIDDIVKFSIEKLAVNHYYKKYYGNFSWLGIRSLWSKKENDIFDKKVKSLEEFEYIKSALKENEECNKRFEETGIYPIRRSYNTMSATISHCRYHDKEGNCSIYDSLCNNKMLRQCADDISYKIRLMNNKESAGKKIVSFIRRRVYN